MEGHQVAGDRAGKVLRLFNTVILSGPEIIFEHANVFLGDIGEDVLALQVFTERVDDRFFLGFVDGRLSVLPEKPNKR
jgi:hypothetical protein